MGAVLAVWTVAASVVLNGTLLTWLSFSEAVGFMLVAVVGLVAHELHRARVVHELQLEPSQRDETVQKYAAAA